MQHRAGQLPVSMGNSRRASHILGQRGQFMGAGRWAQYATDRVCKDLQGRGSERSLLCLWKRRDQNGAGASERTRQV